MLLKRHYIRKLDDSAQPILDEEGRWVLEPILDEIGKPIMDHNGKPIPKLSHVEVMHTGTSRDQHFSADLVAAGIVEGWITIKDGKLTLHVQPENLVYTILRVPGKYPAPTQANPKAVEVIHYYDCILDEAQHEKYCASTQGARKLARYAAAGIRVKRKEVARG
jgi:hypothetical protein